MKTARLLVLPWPTSESPHWSNSQGDITTASRGHIGMHLRDNNTGGGEVARISWAHDGGDSTPEGLGQLPFLVSVVIKRLNLEIYLNLQKN